MPANSKIVDLRNLLATRYPQPALPNGSRLPTGIGYVDEQIGGGLQKGAITELTSPHPSAGSAFFIAALVHVACRSQFFLALVDGRDSFDPQPLGQRVLRHLLWIRCRTAAEALKSTDLLLRDGNIPLVIVDLILNSADQLRKIPQTSWYRLQRLVEPSGTACLVLTRRSIISSAQSKLVLENSWSLEHLDSTSTTSRLRLCVQRTQAGTRINNVEQARTG